MKCIKCNYEINEGNIICPICGNNLSPQDSTTYSQPINTNIDNNTVNQNAMNNQPMNNMNTIQNTSTENNMVDQTIINNQPTNNINFTTTTPENNKKNMIPIIIGGVIVVAIIAFIIISNATANSESNNKNNNDSNSNNSNLILTNSLYRINTDYEETDYTYITSEGEIIEFKDYYKIGSFKYGSALVTKNEEDEKSYIIDSTGKIIVPADKYDDLDEIENYFSNEDYENFIAYKDGSYGLLDSKGKEITEFKYSWIRSVEDTNKIYEIEDYGKIGYITTKGNELIKPVNEEDDVETFGENNSKMFVIKIKDEYKVYNINEYKLITEIKTSDAYVDIEKRYIYDKINKIIYLFNKDIKLVGSIKVDVINDLESGWANQYDETFNIYTDFGYLIYKNINEEDILVTIDGKIIDKKYNNFVIGNGFIFLENYDEDKIYIFNKDTLINTLEGYSLGFEEETIGTLVTIKAPTECLLCNDVYVKFNNEGKKIEETNTENKISMPDGTIIDIKNNKFSSYIRNEEGHVYEGEQNKYNNKYLIVKDESNKYKMIDKNLNIIITFIEEYSTPNIYYLNEEKNIVIYYDNSIYTVYDIKNKKKILESKQEIDYLKGYNTYKTFDYDTGDKYYNLKGELIYPKEK